MESVSDAYRELEDLLNKEIGLYAIYIKLLDEEREAVVSSQTEQVIALSTARSAVIEQMREAQNSRRQFLRRYSADRLLRLSVFVKNQFSPQEAAKLMPLVHKLKKLVGIAQAGSSEISQVVSFSLKLVSGLVSIIWSATQNVVRAYTSIGTIKESYHPTGYGKAAALKQA